MGAPAVTEPKDNRSVFKAVWTLTDADPTGDAVEFPDFPDKSVQIAGTFGGGTVVIQGSNDGTNYVTLADPQGNAISKTSAAIEQILENTLKIRPSISGSTGASVTVTMIGRGPRR